MKRTSRRRFLKSIAAAGGAALVGGVAGASPRRTARKPKPKAAAAKPDPVRAEIENQKQYVAKTLQAIRDYPLPPGSNPAFVFRPLRPARRRPR